MKINIETIQHDQQRYPTVGDWWLQPNGDMEIRVSDMGNVEYEWLVACHEITEALLCKREDIAEESVSDFDRNFEELRKYAPDLIGDQESGDMVSAPYHKQHITASQVEQFVAGVMGMDFRKYEKAINDLDNGK